MRRILLSCFLGLVVLLAGCQQNDLVVSMLAVTTMQVTKTLTSIPTRTAQPTATALDGLTHDKEYFIFVTAIQDRPNEMDEHPRRDDGFAEANPWEIAPAFIPSDGMRFVAVEITTLNLGESVWLFNSAKLVLVDSTGAVYPSQLERAFKSLMPFELRTGQKSQGWVVFEIPVDAVAKDVQYPLDEKRWIATPIDAPTELSYATPHLVTTTSASASNLTLSLLAIKDLGVPFSTFSYTYITGYRPVNLMIELTNHSEQTVRLATADFILMDENHILHFISPGGASEFLWTKYSNFVQSCM